MTDPTYRPSTSEHLQRMSEMAETLRSELATFRETAERSGLTLPIGVLQGLKQLSGTLQMLHETVEGNERDRRNLHALAEIGGAVNSSLDLTTVLNQVIDTIIRLTGAERAFLMLRNEDGEMEPFVARNWEQETLDQAEVEFSRTIINGVLTGGEPVLTTNAQEDPRYEGMESIMAYNLRSILCVPLKVKGELTGVIYADNKVREALFGDRQKSLLSSFADQAAVALENARLFTSVQQTLSEVTELKTLMENVFASIASGVITADVQDIITLCNRAAEEILAVPAEGLLGRSVTSVVPGLSEVLRDQLESVKRDHNRIVGLELIPNLEDRGPVDLRMSISPLKSANDDTQGVAIVLDDLTERKRLEAQKRLFERMVSPRVIRQLDPTAVQLGGTRREITTIFADIRGFTRLSERTDPEVLVKALNAYLAAAVRSVMYEEGTIDKFQGDALMAWFNAPIDQDPDRAVRAALALQKRVKRVREKQSEDFQMSFGVGIHLGDALLGLVGTELRLDYTAIGDSVNTAKRLQEHAAEGQILVSASTVQRLSGDYELTALPPITVHGKQQPIEVYELSGRI
jgi:PAS domain S-box-containing protein